MTIIVVGIMVLLGAIGFVMADIRERLEKIEVALLEEIALLGDKDEPQG